MIIKNIDDLANIRRWHPKARIVYCSGSFDLTHAGHALFFEDCRKHGDILVVGIGADRNIRRLKGADRPILNEYIRLKMVDLLKPVDYVFLDILEAPISRNPLTPLHKYFKTLKPDTYVVNKDGFDIPYRRKLTKKHGIKLIVLKRRCPPTFRNISTTNIIRHIKNMKES